MVGSSSSKVLEWPVDKISWPSLLLCSMDTDFVDNCGMNK